MSLSENIRYYRLQREMTQEQLAEVLGVSAQAVSKWETSDTYPDGTLLMTLANALGVSLDRLFGNHTYDMSELSLAIRGIMVNTPKEERLERVRDICWQIEKGLFETEMQGNYDYLPCEYKSGTFASAYIKDQGFTYIYNGKSPFFTVFTEEDDSFSDAIGDGEEIRKIFSLLARSETMRAVLFVFRKEYDFLFDSTYLAKECEMPDEMIGEVIDDLLSLGLVRKNELEIDGIHRTLYFANQRHQLLALLLLAAGLKFNGVNRYYSEGRNKPYLK